MLKARFFALCLSILTPLSLSSISPSTLAQTPSGGVAGTTSGNNPTGGSQTTIAVPFVGTGNGFTVNSNVTVTPGANGAPPNVSVPAPVAALLNAAGSSVSIAFSTGTLSQQQIATLIASAPAIVTTLDGGVAGNIVLTTAGGPEQTFTSFAGAQSVLTSFTTSNPTGTFTLTVGNITVSVN
jgi:hypothetical protein